MLEGKKVGRVDTSGTWMASFMIHDANGPPDRIRP